MGHGEAQWRHVSSRGNEFTSTHLVWGSFPQQNTQGEPSRNPERLRETDGWAAYKGKVARRRFLFSCKRALMSSSDRQKSNTCSGDSGARLACAGGSLCGEGTTAGPGCLSPCWLALLTGSRITKWMPPVPTITHSHTLIHSYRFIIKHTYKYTQSHTLIHLPQSKSFSHTYTYSQSHKSFT